MPDYVVRVTRITVEECDFTVSANDRDDAELAATKFAEAGDNYEWSKVDEYVEEAEALGLVGRSVYHREDDDADDAR